MWLRGLGRTCVTMPAYMYDGDICNEVLHSAKNAYFTHWEESLTSFRATLPARESLYEMYKALSQRSLNFICTQLRDASLSMKQNAMRFDGAFAACLQSPIRSWPRQERACESLRAIYLSAEQSDTWRLHSNRCVILARASSPSTLPIVCFRRSQVVDLPQSVYQTLWQRSWAVHLGSPAVCSMQGL